MFLFYYSKYMVLSCLTHSLQHPHFCRMQNYMHTNDTVGLLLLEVLINLITNLATDLTM